MWAVTVPPVVFQCRLQKLEFLQWNSSVGHFQLRFSSGIPVRGCFQFFQWCSNVPCKYSLGRPVVCQCTLGQPVTFQWHSSVHWTSQCTLAQGKGLLNYGSFFKLSATYFLYLTKTDRIPCTINMAIWCFSVYATVQMMYLGREQELWPSWTCQQRVRIEMFLKLCCFHYFLAFSTYLQLSAWKNGEMVFHLNNKNLKQSFTIQIT